MNETLSIKQDMEYTQKTPDRPIVISKKILQAPPRKRIIKKKKFLPIKLSYHQIDLSLYRKISPRKRIIKKKFSPNKVIV